MRLLFIIPVVILFSCKSHTKEKPRLVERSFYYWKSVFQLNREEKELLTGLKIQHLYIKYFDVDWDAVRSQAIPIAQITAPASTFFITKQLEIVPTIFITNETIFKINIEQIEPLANKIVELVNQINSNFGITSLKEWQIDCDWTSTTKDKYFTLLKLLQQKKSSVIFSVTIRLHQIKYLNKTGVPPVKKGMLMCYNMGNLSNINTGNSILDVGELRKYIGGLKSYPLNLDVALPLFEWKILFRKNTFKGILENLPDSLLTKNLFTKKGNRYTAIADIILQGYEIKKNDVLREEISSYEDVIKAAALINEKLQGDSINVSIFHLDNLTLRKRKLHELENIYDAMR